MLCRSDSLNICHLNAFVNHQIFTTNKILSLGFENIFRKSFQRP
uniref:Uncharacterized protein n=1 Tax=Rhizophora mucronata TaxID=61149 RepID=A0A2P2Q0J7_RHIMU